MFWSSYSKNNKEMYDDARLFSAGCICAKMAKLMEKLMENNERKKKAKDKLLRYKDLK